jgi:hypothetical protein
MEKRRTSNKKKMPQDAGQRGKPYSCSYPFGTDDFPEGHVALAQSLRFGSGEEVERRIAELAYPEPLAHEPLHVCARDPAILVSHSTHRERRPDVTPNGVCVTCRNSIFLISASYLVMSTAKGSSFFLAGIYHAREETHS